MSYLAATGGILSTLAMHKAGIFAAVSVLFAVFGRLVRGVTTGGAIAGAAVCFSLLWGAGWAGFTALLTVFVLTWLTTRVGYAGKQRLGTAESRTGRDALQVLANLGIAGACAVAYTRFPNRWIFVAMAAALAEAAADTVSSEIGQAFGGVPRLITTWREARQGTNGAITAVGTLAGTVASVVVALVFLASGEIGRFAFLVVAVSGAAGMLADSVLGAKVEGRGRLGNNGVNFISTLIAALCAFLVVRVKSF